MRIGPDIEVICSRCGDKAYFTFPFRKIYKQHIELVRAHFPAAQYEEMIIEQWKSPKATVVRELFDENVWIRSGDAAWLMNLFPELFTRNTTGKHDGLVKCPHCGLMHAEVLRHEKYWYKIPVGDRYLLAGSAKHLTYLRKYFSGEVREYYSPNEDFPAVFYRNKREIVKRITELLEREK